MDDRAGVFDGEKTKLNRNCENASSLGRLKIPIFPVYGDEYQAASQDVCISGEKQNITPTPLRGPSDVSLA
jgi:hypothetical protein